MIPGTLFWLTLLVALANSRPLGAEVGMWGWVAALAFLDWFRHRK